MSAAVVAAALGLVAAPEIGATIAQAFEQLGSEAVFGPGCIDQTAVRTIVAPARWTRTVPERWRGAAVVVMAEIDDRAVTAIHLARPAMRAAGEADCRAAFAQLSGTAPSRTFWRGADLVMEYPAGRIAGHPAHFRAIYRASRQSCRTMLTIGPEGLS